MEDVEALVAIVIFGIILFLVSVVLPILVNRIENHEQYSEWNKEISEWRKAHPILSAFQRTFPLNLILYLFPRPPRMYKNEIEAQDADQN